MACLMVNLCVMSDGEFVCRACLMVSLCAMSDGEFVCHV